MENAQPPKTVKELLDRFQPLKVLTGPTGAKYSAIVKWRQVGRIPACHQAAVLDACEDHGIAGVDANWMVRAHVKPAPATAAE